MKKVLVVDDHALVRKGLISLLTLEEDLESVGEAYDIETGLRMIENEKPDIVLVDLRLGKESGLDLIKRAKSMQIECEFIILTSSAQPSDLQKAKEIASGFVLKEALPEELLYAIRLVANKRKYYDPGLLEIMMTVGNKDEMELINDLTPKEVEVLKELGMGHSNKEIARKLFITENTVKKHVSQILDKLDFTDRTQAALFANIKGIAQFRVS
ncbi:response regulator [Rossellomorea aquimaris]|uniref:response regulator n=1 Tax=Rossellomorea aquimaris TaxID=189382 RepID=UPI0005C9E6A0|nr:response regulator transcription factor [Rossellomorea aquimaris]